MNLSANAKRRSARIALAFVAVVILWIASGWLIHVIEMRGHAPVGEIVMPEAPLPGDGALVRLQAIAAGIGELTGEQSAACLAAGEARTSPGIPPRGSCGSLG